MFIGSRTFDWLTRLQEIVDVEGVVRDHVLRERDDESDLQWEGVIEECKRELISTCKQVATMAGWRPGRPHVRMHPSSSVPGVTRPAAMRTGRGGRHLYSSDEDADEAPAEGQPPSTAAPAETWFPPAPPHIRDYVWGGHLDSHTKGSPLSDAAKQAIRRQVNEFHGERVNNATRVTSLDYWSQASLRFPIVAHVARRCLSIPASSATSERSFSKTGHIVRARRARLSDEHVTELSFLSWNQDLMQ